MKKIIFAMMALIFMMTAAGCSEKEINTAPADMTAEILNSFPCDTMAEVTADRLAAYYAIDPELLDGFSLYIEGSGGFADELAIFKVKDKENLSKIKEAAEQRLSERKAIFESYNPEEYAKLENSTIVTKGSYLLFVVSEDNSIAEKAFSGYFS